MVTRIAVRTVSCVIGVDVAANVVADFRFHGCFGTSLWWVSYAELGPVG